VRLAYADPPYIGCAHLYRDHPDYAGEVDHEALIARLVAEFPDGWALSCTSNSLRYLLPLCPEDVRVGAWVKPFHAYKRGVRPAYAWEPVIYRGGRNKNHPPPAKGGEATTPKDWVAANITLQKGLTGREAGGGLLLVVRSAEPPSRRRARGPIPRLGCRRRCVDRVAGAADGDII
jgi:hypothetical protein